MPNTSKYTNLEPNAAGALSYLIPLLTGVVFYILEKEDKTVRFHALQAVLFWAAVFIIMQIISLVGIFGIGYYINQFVSLGTFLAWLYLMWKTYDNIKIKIPIIGDFAEKKTQ